MPCGVQEAASYAEEKTHDEEAKEHSLVEWALANKDGLRGVRRVDEADAGGARGVAFEKLRTLAQPLEFQTVALRHGIAGSDMAEAINLVGDRLAAFDVMEICPPADHSGITAVLGARLINESLAVLGKNLRQ